MIYLDFSSVMFIEFVFLRNSNASRDSINDLIP